MTTERQALSLRLRVLFLGILAVPLASACAQPPTPAQAVANPAPAQQSGEVSFRMIAPGVWLHSEYHTFPGSGPVVSHGLVVENGPTSILVDTGWDDGQTRDILHWAREDLRRPVTAAVLTHAHSDKMGGVSALQTEGVQTFASRLSNADAPARGLAPAAVSLDFDSSGWLTTASQDTATPLGPLRLFYPGAGHTRDNIVVAVPDAAILFGGCLIRPSNSTDLGNTADGDVANWGTAALNAGRAFPDAEIVIPSHGDPAGRELIDRTAKLARQAVPHG